LSSVVSLGTKVFISDGRVIMSSDDFGKTWRRATQGLEDTSVYQLASYKGRVYAQAVSGLFRSEIDGTSWQRVGPGLPAGSSHRTFARFKDHLVVNTGSGIFRTPDEGLSWQPAQGSLSGDSVETIFDDGNYLFAVTETGLFRSSDVGTTYSRIGDDVDKFFQLYGGCGSGSYYLSGSSRVFSGPKITGYPGRA
jgi:photosystem II stability/assembly factor-like uncharacterized protein